VPEVLRDLEARFGLKRIVFVGDRGMVATQNLDDLRSAGHGYIVGRNRRRSGEVGRTARARCRSMQSAQWRHRDCACRCPDRRPRHGDTRRRPAAVVRSSNPSHADRAAA